MKETYPCVYLVALDSGLHKVGMTENLPHRLQTMKSNCGGLTLLNHWRCADRHSARFYEKWIHARLWRYHTSGREFFSLPNRVVEFMSKVSNDCIKAVAKKEYHACGSYE